MEYRQLGASGLKVPALTLGTLDAADAVPLTYPYWHQRLTFTDRNPPPVYP